MIAKNSYKALLWLKAKKIFQKADALKWIFENFNSIEDFFNMSISGLQKKGWPQKLSKKTKQFKGLNFEVFEKQLIAKNTNIVCVEDSLYPPLLLETPDPPPLLFYRGDIKILLNKTVSIVGSRKCTKDGIQIAYKIASVLAANNYAVISGLASGIDSSAHKGALKNGKTAAILGCGLDVCYPASNCHLFNKISNTGCLVSEFWWDEKPLRYHFPFRNRIISGLSKTLIVIQAGEKSGAMVTANLALDQGREILAVPGNPIESFAKGCNLLIKEGAFLIDSVKDLELFFDITDKKPAKKIDDPLLRLIASKPKSLDQLVALSGKSPQELLSKLTYLEIKKIISKNEKNDYFINI